MKPASVAVPTASTPEVRMPAKITGAARGSRTCVRTWAGVIPNAIAAAAAPGSASRTPLYVFRTIGYSE